MSASARDMARYMRMLLGDGTRDGVTIFGPQAARGRQLRYSVTLAIFAALGWLLAAQGALVPWHY